MKKYTGMLAVVALVLSATTVATADDAVSTDQVRAAVQGICPVSGQKLGAHGKPIKAKIGQEEIFLCCQGCLKRKVDAKHWGTIHANFAKAQAKCPVMNKPLPQNPKWTVTNGQIIYICCPPCSKKIAADPKTYLSKVNALYTASLKSESQPR